MKQDNIKQNGFRALTDNEIEAVSGGEIVVNGGSIRHISPRRIPSNFGGGGGGTSFGPTISDGSAVNEIVVNGVQDNDDYWPSGGPVPYISPAELISLFIDFFADREDGPSVEEIVVTGNLEQGQLLVTGEYLKHWPDGVITIYDPSNGIIEEVERTTADKAEWVVTTTSSVEISADGQVISGSQTSTGSVTVYYKPVS